MIYRQKQKRKNVTDIGRVNKRSVPSCKLPLSEIDHQTIHHPDPATRPVLSTQPAPSSTPRRHYHVYRSRQPLSKRPVTIQGFRAKFFFIPLQLPPSPPLPSPPSPALQSSFNAAASPDSKLHGAIKVGYWRNSAVLCKQQAGESFMAQCIPLSLVDRRAPFWLLGETLSE